MTFFARTLSAQAIWNHSDGKEHAYDSPEHELTLRGV
jgi:hypothetical protein